MKNKLFRKHASVIPTGAPTLRSGQAAWSGGIPSFRRFLAVLGMTALFCWSATAQNGVTVSNLAVHAGTVTFNVSWKKADMPALWSDSVWVFVDYNKAGRMERLPVTSATATAGTVEKISGNDTGVRLIGNARSAGSFSATVQLLTSQLDVAGACAYASNYPPVGEYTEANKIKFTGTPPYDLVLTSAESGTYTYSINDSYYHLHEGETLQSFTDKTGAPGRIQSIYAYPPTAASAATWSYGNRTWSDVVNSPPSACTQGYSPSTTTNPLYVVNNNLHYFNWFCVNTAASQLCPYPWRVANYDDFVSLIQSTTGSSLKQAWPERGFVRDTYYEQSSILYGYTNAAGDACAYQIDSGTFHTSRCHPSLYYALPVRCVR